jgi:hypothetical protein
MSSLFIETMAKRQEQERIKNQKVKMANQRIAEVNSGGYQWGLIEELKKDVAPTGEAVMDSDTAHQEFMNTLEHYGLGGSKEIYNAMEQVLGDRYNNPYFKRMLTIAIDLIMQKKSEKRE